jgi:hypothetical protein
VPEAFQTRLGEFTGAVFGGASRSMLLFEILAGDLRNVPGEGIVRKLTFIVPEAFQTRLGEFTGAVFGGAFRSQRRKLNLNLLLFRLSGERRARDSIRRPPRAAQ